MGCERVYIASDHRLPLAPFQAEGDFWVGELEIEEDREVRLLFTKPHIYYLGSHGGCGCGFSYYAFQMGDYALWRQDREEQNITNGFSLSLSEEQYQEVWEKVGRDKTEEDREKSRISYEEGRISVQRLRDYLSAATDLGPVELYVRWGYNLIGVPKLWKTITPDYFASLSFSLNSLHEAFLIVKKSLSFEG
jgi:hypothetical protein